MVEVRSHGVKPARRATNTACAAVLVVEVIGSLSMWAPIPLAWLWIGAQAYAVTGSLLAGCGVALLGFVATTILVMKGLARIDTTWVALRRRAGHKQPQGALTQVVVISATLGIALFLLWYYILENAFILPFMPSQ
jgi:hypothetical protein